MIVLHTSKTIPKRFDYIPLKQYQNDFDYISLKQYQNDFITIVLEVCNTIVLVLF
jgi:hypothetical protein